jgi:hypothetical protein
VSASAIAKKTFAHIAELFEPNVETVAAVEAANRGEVVGTVEEMLAALHKDD